MNRDLKNKASHDKMNESRRQLKDKLASADSEISKMLAKRRQNHKVPEKIEVGDNVYIVSFDQHGVVLSAPDENKNVMVQMGIMKMQVPMAELVIDEKAQAENKAQNPKNNMRSVSRKASAGKSMFVSPEIDCRGQTVDEGIGNIDKYIDDAFLAGLQQVTIIHGKGTGVLREAVQKFLKRHPHVKSFRPGVYGEGEMGVTVVELKK